MLTRLTLRDQLSSGIWPCTLHNIRAQLQAKKRHVHVKNRAWHMQNVLSHVTELYALRDRQSSRGRQRIWSCSLRSVMWTC